MARFLTWWMFAPLGVLVLLLVCAVIWWVVSRLIASRQRRYLQTHAHFVRPTKASGLRPPVMKFDIDFVGLGLTLKGTQRKVLEGVTGRISSGRTTAVMGPSGSGKTTFLTTLAGRATYGETTGQILLNGKEDSLVKYPKLVGFVPQEDVMHRDCTVLENLLFSAKTRLPAELTAAERLDIVENVMAMLGLQELRFSLIGDEDTRGISGGQRKRVNVGIELVSDPSVLFLDEPTSGLDSSSSKEICGCLQQLARGGMTIVAVIHSPRYEIFEMFDDVLLLGKGGHTVYLGPTQNALVYFEQLGFQCPPRVNAADFLMDVISGEVPREGHPEFRASDLPEIWAARQQDRIAPVASGPSLPLASCVQLTGDVHLQERDGEKMPLLQRVPPSGPIFSAAAEPDSSECYCWASYYECDLCCASNCCCCYPAHSASHRDEDGYWWQLIAWGVFNCILAVPLPVNMYNTKSVRARYGGLLGSLFMFSSAFIACFASFTSFAAQSGSWGASDCALDPIMIWLLVFFAVSAAFGTGLLIYAIYLYNKRKDPSLLSHFWSGFLLGILFLPVAWSRRSITPRERYATVLGFGALLVYVGLILGSQAVMFNLEYSCTTLDDQAMPTWIWGVILPFMLLGGTLVIVLSHRYGLLPTFDRVTPSWWKQTFWVAERSIVQQLRFPLGLAFDLFLPIFSAAFLGILSYNHNYTDPLIQSLPNATCPSIVPTYVCTFLELPPDDPIPGRASLTSLSLALSAVASSMRTFGNEKVIFKREKRGSLSTEAYYLGKSLAHLPTITAAPLFFSLIFYAFIQPMAPFWQYFCLYLSIYFACAGLAYLVSVVTPANIAQLIGVLVILVFMMFSGANPTLESLKHNDLIPYALYYPSFSSLFRWTNELYYLVESAPYSPSNQTLAIYGYAANDVPSCLVGIFLIILLVRLAAYLAMVKQEE